MLKINLEIQVLYRTVSRFDLRLIFVISTFRPSSQFV